MEENTESGIYRGILDGHIDCRQLCVNVSNILVIHSTRPFVFLGLFLQWKVLFTDECERERSKVHLRQRETLL